MDTRRRMVVVAAAVIFGSLWGLAEASLGHLLHLAARFTPMTGLAGLVMFPVAFACMSAAFGMSGSVAAIPLTAVITAAIKMASLALPSVTLIFVVNPTLAILGEGAAVLAFFVVLRGSAEERPLPAALALSVAWRVVFLLAVALLPVPKGILRKGAGALGQFLILESLANGLLIAALLKARLRWDERDLPWARLPLPVMPGVLLAGAVITTLLLTRAPV